MQCGKRVKPCADLTFKIYTRALLQRGFESQPKDRQDLVDKFQSNPSVRVALLGLTAAGIGITLTAASRCVCVL